MKSTAFTGVALVAVIALLSGCGATGNLAGGTTSEDEVAVSTAMSSDPEIIDDGLTGDESVTQAAARSRNEPEAAVHPRRFWRTITRVVPRYEFAFADTDSTGRPTVARVTVHKQIFGFFNLVAATASGDSVRPGDVQLIRKRLSDEWVRHVVLHRVALPDSMAGEHRRFAWRVAGASLAKVTSNVEGAAETRIVSVRVQSGDRDTTITDPLGTFFRDRLPSFPAGSTVQMTVTTTHPDDIVALVSLERRFFLVPQGDNTYTGSWVVPPVVGVRHVGVNALSHGTVFDDSDPYSSQAWLWPCGIREPSAGN